MSETDRRNPYVILGIPFGVSEKEARTGFARAKRRIQDNANAPFSQEDLTWALHQVEQIILKPELAFEVYRIPAVIRSDLVGVFNPLPHRTERKTKPANANDWDRVKRSAVSRALVDALSKTLADQPSVIPYETA